MKIAISAGHGLHVQGANGLINEVEEARKVTSETAAFMRRSGAEVAEFYDNTSTTQDENLATIVNWHNDQDRTLDISVHFNAAEPTTGARGTEVWYVTEGDLAAQVSKAIADAGGLTDRGAKYSDSLYFLNNTDMPAILLEICFVDAQEDVEHYQEHFDVICEAIAYTIVGRELIA